MRDTMYESLSGVKWRVSPAGDVYVAVGHDYPQSAGEVDDIEQAWMEPGEARRFAAALIEAANVAEAKKESTDGK